MDPSGPTWWMQVGYSKLLLHLALLLETPMISKSTKPLWPPEAATRMLMLLVMMRRWLILILSPKFKDYISFGDHLENARISKHSC